MSLWACRPTLGDQLHLPFSMMSITYSLQAELHDGMQGSSDEGLLDYVLLGRTPRNITTCNIHPRANEEWKYRRAWMGPPGWISHKWCVPNNKQFIARARFIWGSPTAPKSIACYTVTPVKATATKKRRNRCNVLIQATESVFKTWQPLVTWSRLGVSVGRYGPFRSPTSRSHFRSVICLLPHPAWPLRSKKRVQTEIVHWVQACLSAVAKSSIIWTC